MNVWSVVEYKESNCSHLLWCHTFLHLGYNEVPSGDCQHSDYGAVCVACHIQHCRRRRWPSPQLWFRLDQRHRSGRWMFQNLFEGSFIDPSRELLSNRIEVSKFNSSWLFMFRLRPRRWTWSVDGRTRRSELCSSSGVPADVHCRPLLPRSLSKPVGGKCTRRPPVSDVIDPSQIFDLTLWTPNYFLPNSCRRQINFSHVTARRRINFRQTSSSRQIIFWVRKTSRPLASFHTSN